MPHASRAIRIGLIGGECTGKSTLARDLVDELNRELAIHSERYPPVRILIVGERLRQFVATQGRTPRPDEQGGIMADQRTDEDRAAGVCDIAIADPATIMTAVYSELYFGDLSLWPLALRDARDYHLLLWCRPDIPWEPDPGQRDGPSYRQGADEIIARAVASEPALQGGTIRQIHGDRDARRQQAVTHAMATLEAVGVWRKGPPGNRT